MTKQISIELEQSENELNVKQILSSVLGFSRRQISSAKAKNQILLNDQICPLTEICHTGDQLTVLFDDSALYTLFTGDVEVLFEDDHILIVNKPAGLACHASHEHQDDNLCSVLENVMECHLHPVGRLDKDVSGVMVYGKDKKTTALLSREKSDALFHKKYYALAEGTFVKTEDTIHTRLSLGNHKTVIDDHGKTAVSHYHVLHQYPSYTLVEVQIETGRKHQIRCSLASIHHPLVGDTLYGSADQSLHRPALHCHEIAFIHPYTKKEIHIVCELPDDMKQLLL